jgi:hypothetical protein
MRTGMSGPGSGFPHSRPSRNRFGQWKIWLAFTPWRRATTAAEAPGCKDSSAICRRSGVERCRRDGTSTADISVSKFPVFIFVSARGA